MNNNNLTQRKRHIFELYKAKLTETKPNLQLPDHVIKKLPLHVTEDEEYKL